MIVAVGLYSIVTFIIGVVVGDMNAEKKKVESK